jgi:hypothetical protein
MHIFSCKLRLVGGRAYALHTALESLPRKEGPTAKADQALFIIKLPAATQIPLLL